MDGKSNISLTAFSPVLLSRAVNFAITCSFRVNFTYKKHILSTFICNEEHFSQIILLRCVPGNAENTVCSVLSGLQL